MPSNRIRKLLLLDALGAALSAVLLGLILPSLEGRFGMPEATLHLLALIAAIFALHGCLGGVLGRETPATWLRRIAIANVLYCALTGVLVAWNYSLLTVYDLVYFPLEVLLILALVHAEQRALAEN
jgi:hypothetical protein